MLTPLQQAIDLIQKSQKILIPLPENIDGDNLGCALALALALGKLNKKTDIVSLEPIPEKLKFLPALDKIKNELTASRDFIISIDTSENKIAKLRYETADKTLKIYLTTPARVEQKDIKLEPGPFAYDLIVVLGAPDLESLGRLHEQNTELFFDKPILNIDHQAANEHFGEINLIEPTAAADAEIIARLIEKIRPDLIDQEIATCLLTGLIAATRSFQNINTTPQALNLASLLISRGAAQETIIQRLYKTKPLNSLRLWGRLLGKAELDEKQKTIWLPTAADDFTATATTSQNLFFILEETEDYFPQINRLFILWPGDNGLIEVLAQIKQPEILQQLNLQFGGTAKNNRALFKLSAPDMAQAKEQIKRILESSNIA
ncbi:MAG: hypothetical protein UU87_C0003G0067 [Parcubacteria group bacterium GW2011_GWA2_42_11]|nr:MAG: hypothetical protein UU87_C0003G0067 [Parcubacteria group bacterium GW2011_GWA2_42_11]